MKKLSFFIAVVFALGGCKPYEPDTIEPSTNPVFSVAASFNGNPILMDADAGFISTSSFDTDSLGVAFYVGDMAPCAFCQSEFTFRWRSNDKENPSINATVMDREPAYRYAFNTDTQQVYNVTLQAEPSAAVSSYLWTIEGVNYATESVEVQFSSTSNMTKFPVTLEATYASGCTSSITDTVYLPNHGCDCDIKAKIIDSLQLNYKAVATGGSSFDYMWNFESGSPASSSEVNYYYDNAPADGVDEVQLSIQTENCRASNKWNQLFPQNSTACTINFSKSIEVQSIVVPGSLQDDLGQIELEYTDGNGDTWKSILVEQDQASSFKVLNVEEYLDPFTSNTNRTSMKVEAEFNCLLSNGSDVMRMSNGKFVLPIGIGAD
jgi:hypothetical protein